ncbi:hypothetical protein ACFPLB_06735 [Aquamicrobium segne]|uniref:Uncharacterized protein n=1 Tax=Aquamicrobium segne TaxID=469547 RepID=A0ABW0GYU0_9HYPH
MAKLENSLARLKQFAIQSLPPEDGNRLQGKDMRKNKQVWQQG